MLQLDSVMHASTLVTISKVAQDSATAREAAVGVTPGQIGAVKGNDVKVKKKR